MSKQFSFVNFSGLNLVNKCIIVYILSSPGPVVNAFKMFIILEMPTL